MRHWRAFSGTLVAFVVALGLSWLARLWLLGAWLSPFLDAAARAGAEVQFPDESAGAGITLTVVVLTATLLAFPVFAAQAWLLVCRVTRREQARRWAVPFCVASAGAMLLALWLLRQAEITFFSFLLAFDVPGVS